MPPTVHGGRVPKPRQATQRKAKAGRWAYTADQWAGLMPNLLGPTHALPMLLFNGKNA